MSKKKRKLSAVFLSWLLTWPKITFLAVNIIIFVLAITPTTLMIKYLSAKLLWFTLCAPLVIFPIKSLFVEPKKTISQQLFNWLLACVLIAVMIFGVINFGTQIYDAFLDPVYITGKVESINDQYKGPTEVYLQDDDQRYFLFMYKIDVIEDEAYRFRLMPNSHNVIAVDVLSDSQ